MKDLRRVKLSEKYKMLIEIDPKFYRENLQWIAVSMQQDGLTEIEAINECLANYDEMGYHILKEAA